MNDEGLRALYELRAGVLARHPELARGAEQAFVVLGVGLGCEVEYADADRRLVVGLPGDEGGDAPGPHPEQLMRAALGAGLAQGYKIWGARLGVPITRVELAVRCQVDARGRLGLETQPGAAIGWECVDVDVTITSPAAESAVRAVVETANRLSPMLANLSPDVRRRHRLTVIAERSVPSDVTPER